MFDFDDEDDEQESKPNLGEFWKVRNGTQSLYAIISNENPLVVKYFTPTVKGNYYFLDEKPFDVCFEDLDQKIDPPKIIPKGKRRKFYVFDEHEH